MHVIVGVFHAGIVTIYNGHFEELDVLLLPYTILLFGRKLARERSLDGAYITI